MEFRRSKEFRRQFERLPDDIKAVVKRQYLLFAQNPHPPYHPSLRVKSMKGYPGIWEGHITEGYVFTFQRERDDTGQVVRIVFRKIGKHDIYSAP